MARKDVRLAVVQFFDQSVDGLSTVYVAKPRNIAPTAYYRPGSSFGAIAYPYFPDQHERRIEMRGAAAGGGGKKRVYMCDFNVIFRAKAKASETIVDQHDQLMDDIVALLHSDPQMNTGGDPVWQAGEGDDGSEDIAVLSDLPEHEGNHSTIWSIVRFTIVEMLKS